MYVNVLEQGYFFIRNLIFSDANIKQKTISSKDMFKFLLIKYVKKT